MDFNEATIDELKNFLEYMKIMYDFSTEKIEQHEQKLNEINKDRNDLIETLDHYKNDQENIQTTIYELESRIRHF